MKLYQVFQPQYTMVQGNMGNITATELISFMTINGYLVLDRGQVSSFPHHNIVCPVSTRTLSLTPAEATLIKKVKMSPHSPLSLVSSLYPTTRNAMEQLVTQVISQSAGMVFLTSTKFTGKQGRVDMAWPGYGYVRKDKQGGGVILHHHFKLVV